MNLLQKVATKDIFYKEILEQMEDAIIIFNELERNVYLNKIARQLYNLDRERFTVEEFSRLGKYFSKENIELPKEKIPLFRVVKGEVLNHEEFWLEACDGKLYNLLACGNQIVCENEILGSVVLFHDNTEQKNYEEKIKYYAFHDIVTDLPNRRKLKELLKEMVQKQESTKALLATFFLDLDFFKLINDHYGHDAGDHLLKTVANRLVGMLPSSSVISRIGGDEFVVAVPSLENKEEVKKIASLIKTVFLEPFTIDATAMNITTSMGISIYPNDTTDISKLITMADKAMYAAKHNGKNNFQFFSNEKPTQSVITAVDLANALTEKQFKLLYQPKVNVETMKMEGVEALIRWEHPTQGLIAPDKFIPLAEDTDLIIPIGEWVLKEACLQAKKWEEKNLPLRVAVNFSPKQFESDSIISTIKRILDETKLQPHLLEIELTERITIKDIKFVTNTLNMLDNLGVKIALDDFGKGYSSLNYLKNFPIDLIKIDKSFINDCVSSEKDAFIIKAIITMAKGLNVKVLAEGVETKEQLKFLKLLGCNEVQGYYFSRPVSSQQIEEIYFNKKSI